MSQLLMFAGADPQPRQRRLARPGFAHDRSEESTEWYTPPEVFEALGLEFDLDPAAPSHNGISWIPALKFYGPEQNGLRQPWRGRVWLNPPYGDETPRWLAKLAHHASGIALVFARTDTRWFHDVATRADARCFTRGRIQFIRPDGTRGEQTGAGSLLLAWGQPCAEAVQHCGLGWVC